jgi:divalent metal cation (Fe/Co/Zn/Cd) transporter
VKQGHDLVDALEDELVAAVPNLHVSTHLEPLEDETAYADRAM